MKFILLFLLATAKALTDEMSTLQCKEFRNNSINLSNNIISNGYTDVELGIHLNLDSTQTLEYLYDSDKMVTRSIGHDSYLLKTNAAVTHSDNQLEWNITLPDGVRPIVHNGITVGFIDTGLIPDLHKRGVMDWVSIGFVLVSGGYIVLKAGVTAVHSKSLSKSLSAARNASLDVAAFLGNLAFTLAFHLRNGPTRNQ